MPKQNFDQFLRSPSEEVWVKRQPFLLFLGYRLRPRYDPDWVPSWKLPRKKPYKHVSEIEDGLRTGIELTGRIMDAVRIHANGARVVIKEVATWKEEIPIALYLSSDTLRKDPRNCAVPILDVLLLPDTDELALMVMPMLLRFDRLPFRRVGEVAEMFLQWLKGLEMMHEHHIAHRDACCLNIMMDPSRVIPGGFHFGKWRTVDGIHRIVWNDRWDNCREIGQIGQDRSVPEMLTLFIPYDPFKSDIYQLGNVILGTIAEYEDLELFQDIGMTMTKVNLDERPLAYEAAQQLETGLNSSTLKRRVWRIGEYRLGTVDRFLVKYFGTTCLY